MDTILGKLSELAEIFCLPGKIKEVNVINNGHINASYDVVMECDGVESRYVFQKLNIYVFKNPKQIMSNIEKITSHIAEKLEAAVGVSIDKRKINLKENIKAYGNYDVELKLQSDVIAKFIVSV